MAFTNNMTEILNKIERRLGTKPLNLPDDLKKEMWAEVICSDTLTTFSRFFPHIFRYKVDVSRDKYKNGYYYIDEDYIGDVKILGVRDVDFSSMGASSSAYSGDSQYGVYDPYCSGFGFEEMAMAQMRADQGSLFNRGMFVDFQPPNQISVTSAGNRDIVSSLTSFNVDLLIKHPDNLATIEPTKMETFEKLALIDIKIFLYQSLKHYDDLETVFATVKLNIDEWSGSMDERESFIEKLNDQYVSAANRNQPVMMSI